MEFAIGHASTSSTPRGEHRIDSNYCSRIFNHRLDPLHQRD
jgi:hypothetical protein